MEMQRTTLCALNLTSLLCLVLGMRIDPISPNELINMVDTISSSLYPKSNLECAILAVVNRNNLTDSAIFEFHQAKHAAISVTEDYIASHEEPVSLFLQKHIGCIIATFAGNSLLLKSLISTLRKVEQHFIFNIDGNESKLSALSSSGFPIAWTETFQKRERERRLVSLYCPKEDRLKSIIVKFSMTQLNEIKCPHYLKGQKLGLGHIPYGMKKIINGKPVFGENYVRFFEYVSKKFGFSPWFKLGRVVYFPRNESWGGIQAQVIEGKVLMARGRVNMRHKKDMEIMFPHMEQNINFISRMPRVLENIDGFLLPFSPMLWIINIFSLVCLSTMFYVTHSLYASPELMQFGLHKPEFFESNFLLFTFGKLTEPDPIPWFSNKWSTGKFVTFVWSLFSLLIVSFYNCNLRAHLSAVDYEKPIESAKDVIQNGKRPWLMSELAQNQVGYLEQTGQTHTALYKVALMAQEMNGFYSFTQHRGIPIEAIKDIVENNAVAILADNILKENVRLSPRYKEARNGDMLYLSKQRAFYMSFCMEMRKYTPVRSEMNLAVLNAVEIGLFSKWSQEGLPIEAFLDYDSLQAYDEKKPMIFRQVLLPLLFCAAGLVIAGLTMAWETRVQSLKEHSIRNSESSERLVLFSKSRRIVVYS